MNSGGAGGHGGTKQRWNCKLTRRMLIRHLYPQRSCYHRTIMLFGVPGKQKRRMRWKNPPILRSKLRRSRPQFSRAASFPALPFDFDTLLTIGDELCPVKEEVFLERKFLRRLEEQAALMAQSATELTPCEEPRPKAPDENAKILQMPGRPATATDRTVPLAKMDIDSSPHPKYASGKSAQSNKRSRPNTPILSAGTSESTKKRKTEWASAKVFTEDGTNITRPSSPPEKGNSVRRQFLSPDLQLKNKGRGRYSMSIMTKYDPSLYSMLMKERQMNLMPEIS